MFSFQLIGSGVAAVVSSALSQVKIANLTK